MEQRRILVVDDDRLKSRQAGFDMHLVKPVEPETLMMVLSAAA